MRKIYSFKAEGRHPDRVLDAVKHDIRKYLKRERRRDLPEGADFWDFDCRFGPDKNSAEGLLVSTLIAAVDAAARRTHAAARHVIVTHTPRCAAASACALSPPDWLPARPLPCTSAGCRRSAAAPRAMLRD